MKKIDILLIDYIAEQIKEKLCTYSDFEKRQKFEIEVVNILIKNLTQYIEGDY